MFYRILRVFVRARIIRITGTDFYWKRTQGKYTVVLPIVEGFTNLIAECDWERDVKFVGLPDRIEKGATWCALF